MRLLMVEKKIAYESGLNNGDPAGSISTLRIPTKKVQRLLSSRRHKIKHISFHQSSHG